MIGPFDERRVCFRNGFNPYATHTFGIMELLQVAEALGAQAMVGMNINEPREAVINVAPKIGKATIKRSNAKYTFPRYSYTVITLKK